ncbi:MAG: DUF1844 domain-containing protein [Myxococcota bacterium]
MEESDKGFKIQDRRRFDEHGQSRADAPDEPPAGPTAAELPGGSELRAVDFATFVMSLSTPAYFYMGEVPHPGTGRVERDLVLAKETIDLLGLLQEKTRGNLTPEEQQLLDSVLYELRVKYVEELRKEPDAAAQQRG